MTNKSTTSITRTSELIILDDQQREELLELGKLRWGLDEIATFFGWDRHVLKKELDSPDSEVSRILRRGELQGQYEIESRLFNDAKGGNLSAVKEFKDIMRDRSFKHTKLDLFGAAEKSDIFETIQRYFESDEPGNLSVKEQTYLDLLQIIHSFDHQYGKRKTIKILTTPPFSLSFEYASELYANAIEMFNSGRHNTKESLRRHTADQLDTLYHSILEKATTTKDYALAASVLEKRSKLLGLNEPDEQTLPAAQYMKTYRLLSLTPEAIGLPAANRDILAAQIDALEDVPESEKTRLRMEAGVEDVDITKLLQNVTQEES